MLDLTMNVKVLEQNAKHCRERGITLPTFKMMMNPREYVPSSVKDKLKSIGLWDMNPLNLYRITWKNEPKEQGGGFGGVNFLKLPRELTGVRANIVAITGRWFPTGAHKVGATYGCLIPRLVTGQYNPQTTKAVWPSTGNYCRGGAYVSALMGCQSIAILPEEMSKERFEWLKTVAGQIIATPGCESNVKEIFDKCWELRKGGEDLMIFNQFDELGNPFWHYNVTGRAIQEAVSGLMNKGERFAGGIFSSGSAGTMGAGYYLKKHYPEFKLGVAEALQCPTILHNGFGGHRIEGIGDKHIPWIHDLKTTDLAVGVDDEQAIRLLRLFNEQKGRKALLEAGLDPELADKLGLLGISGIGNLIAAIKMAKYYELTENDYLVTVFTDSMQLYGSRLHELEEERGVYSEKNAYQDLELRDSLSTADVKELNYYDRKAVHNLKYFTWIEQQGKELKELNAQWYNHENYWQKTFDQVAEVDHLIEEFNSRIGLHRS